MNLEEVRKVFNDWAPIYNPTHGWTLPKRRTARLALGLRLDDHVLDLACGTGLNFPHLRELVGERGQVVGVDLSPGMLNIARRLIAARGWKNVETHEADAAQLPFPDESFDRVICSYALNIIPSYRRAIEEVKRVLVPGGRFVSVEMHMKLHSLAHICAVDIRHDTLGGLKEVFGDVQVSRYWLSTISIATATK